MCGIAGIVGGPGDCYRRLGHMMRGMAHRGPDGHGTLRFDGGAAGAVRLALVDLSERGQQPIWSADKRVAILFNGEMYNHNAERARLAAHGYAFVSASDTEVVLALYLEHGVHFVQHVRGMFGLAIFDWRDGGPGNRPKVILARDPFGIKPLYLCWPEGPTGSLLFSSELRSLLGSGLVERKIDREALVDYLAIGFVLQPRTMIGGVRMLEAGSLLELAPNGKVTVRRFWEMPSFEPVRETLDQAADRLREVLEESVALHAMADVPVGAFLSGGVDSSGMVGLMIKRNARLRTYTVRFPELSGADEAAQATAFAAALGCDHTVVDVTGREVRDLLPRFASEIDQPSVDGLNTWLISRAAARDVKGVISGLGGDEWFSGYPAARVVQDFSVGGLKRKYVVPARIAAVIRDLVPKSALARRVDGLSTKAHPVATWIDCHRIFGYLLAHQLANGGGAPPEHHDGVQRVLPMIGPDWRRESPLGLASLLDLSVYMGCQLLRDSDATSMASSLELRVPLVDRKVAEFARSCAEEFKRGAPGNEEYEYGRTGSKRVLIHALRDVLPRDIVQAPKRGFGLPYEYWIGHELGSVIDETCSRDTMTARGLVDPELLSRLVPAGRSSAPWPQTWALMILELWCQAVLDGPSASGVQAL